jgi:hypothetical protein
MNLSSLAIAKPEMFADALDLHTEELLRGLPEAGRHWGVSRKLLNIFVRDCLYSRHLCGEYRLEIAEEHFEVPLDSISGGALRRAAGSRVPIWRGVKYVDPLDSRQYQTAASEIAEQQGFARVHLDAVWWGAR